MMKDVFVIQRGRNLFPQCENLMKKVLIANQLSRIEEAALGRLTWHGGLANGGNANRAGVEKI
jgi:hypothetical protein